MIENVSLLILKRRLFIVSVDLALNRSCHSRCLNNTKVSFWILKNSHKGKLLQKKNRFSIQGNGNTCNSWLLSDLTLYLVLWVLSYPQKGPVVVFIQ